ncbi:MAG: alpha/beta hydrolase family protein [Promethearchaeota archaeon]
MNLKKQLGKINKTDKNYSLQPFLKKWIEKHPPTLSYNLRPSDTSFKEWKKQIFSLIREKIKVLDPLPLNEQNIEVHGEVEAEGIKFIKLSLSIVPGLRMPAILCVPSNITHKTPAVICIHGHGQSVNTTVGFKRSKSKEYFGYELAKLGLITVSVDWIGSGEREDFKNKFIFFYKNEGHLSNWVRFLGLDMQGLRITEVKGLINYLETREEIDSGKIGIIGHSGGGTLALFSSFFDERIKLCATSGYFGTWEHSILAMYHCGCNYSADLRKYVELYDLYAALAPLPLVISTGKKDKIFPYQGTKIAIPIIQSAYEESKNPDNLLIQVHPKDHKFIGDDVYPFILKTLKRKNIF